MAVKRSDGGDEGATSIWEVIFGWIIEHPLELAIATIFIIIFYFVWKWISKYWFHEIYLYRPEYKVRRYLGRMLWFDTITRNRHGQVICTECGTRYLDLRSMKEIDNFICTTCGFHTDMQIDVKPTRDVEYANIKLFEQLIPLRFKVISVEKEHLNYYKRRFLPLDRFRRQNYYQRIGITGLNLYWNKDWGVHEVRNDFLKNQIWDEDKFHANNEELLENVDSHVMFGIQVNPQVVVRHLRETNIALPPEGRGN